MQMIEVSHKQPEKFNAKDLIKIKEWMIKDILKYAYTQEVSKKHFDNFIEVRPTKEDYEMILQMISFPFV